MIRYTAHLAALAALMWCARSFAPDEGIATTTTWGIALAFGFLLLAAHEASRVFAVARLPHVTAYLLTGFVAGPEVTNLVTTRMLDQVAIIDGVAVALIALLAGSELCFARLRARMGTILVSLLLAMCVTMVVVASVAWLVAPYLPFARGLAPEQRAAVAVTLGVVISALSPAVTLAVVGELRSRGPATESLLGVVVLADLVIIVVFTLVHAFTARVFGVASESSSPAAQLSIELGGSVLAGVALAGLLALYLRRVRVHVPHALLALCFLASEVGARLHLEVMAMCLTCGLVVVNVFRASDDEIREHARPVETAVFAIFFAVAGARLHVRELAELWPLALVFYAARAASLTASAWIGATLSKAPAEVRATLPWGMVSQAGVAIGLSVLLARHFPSWGPEAGSLVLAVIALNELTGPLLLRRALAKSGESRFDEEKAESALPSPAE